MVVGVWGVGFAIGGFTWRPVSGVYIPWLRLVCEREECWTPLWGEVLMELAERGYCRFCGGWSGGGRWACSLCESSRWVRMVRCILEGAGVPFGCSCSLDLSSLPCGSVARARGYCGSEHVVYIAGFGSRLKAGVTRLARGGEPRGYVSRLVEQGAWYAVVLSGGLSLPEAQRAERTIARELGLAVKVTSWEKIDALSDDPEVCRREVEDVAEEAIDEYGLKLLDALDLTGFYHPLPPEFDVCMEPQLISGAVTGAMGPLIALSSDGSTQLISLTSLVGRGVVDWEI